MAALHPDRPHRQAIPDPDAGAAGGTAVGIGQPHRIDEAVQRHEGGALDRLPRQAGGEAGGSVAVQPFDRIGARIGARIGVAGDQGTQGLDTRGTGGDMQGADPPQAEILLQLAFQCRDRGVGVPHQRRRRRIAAGAGQKGGRPRRRLGGRRMAVDHQNRPAAVTSQRLPQGPGDRQPQDAGADHHDVGAFGVGGSGGRGCGQGFSPRASRASMASSSGIASASDRTT